MVSVSVCLPNMFIIEADDVPFSVPRVEILLLLRRCENNDDSTRWFPSKVTQFKNATVLSLSTQVKKLVNELTNFLSNRENKRRCSASLHYDKTISIEISRALSRARLCLLNHY